MPKGWDGKFSLTSEVIKNAFQKQGLTFEKAAETAKANWDANQEKWTAASDKPPKIEMPVIENPQGDAPPAVADVAAKLSQGTIDVYKDKQQPTQQPTQQAQSSQQVPSSTQISRQ